VAGAPPTPAGVPSARMSAPASKDTAAGLPVNRVEALTDGVFAIAMTLLVFGVELPHTTDSLASRLWSLCPKLASYALSFVMLGVLCIGHHYQLNHLRRTDRALIWLNLSFLLAITFLPFGGCRKHHRGKLTEHPNIRRLASLWETETRRPAWWKCWSPGFLQTQSAAVEPVDEKSIGGAIFSTFY
jgi:Endosomal/lysosomal potassium channel TMEM175